MGAPHTLWWFPPAPMRLVLTALVLLAAAGCDPSTPSDPGDDPGEPVVETTLSIRGGVGQRSFTLGDAVPSGDRLFLQNADGEIAAVAADGQRVIAGASAGADGLHLTADGQGGVVALGRLFVNNGAQVDLVATRYTRDLDVVWTQRLEVRQGVAPDGPFYAYRVAAGGGHAVVLAGARAIALDMSTGQPQWSTQPGASSEWWFGGLADGAGVTLFGRISGRDLLVQRIGWDGATAWRRVAESDQGGGTALLTLGSPVALSGGDALVAYTLREFTNQSGVLRISASGAVTDNWSHRFVGQTPSGSFASRDIIGAELRLRTDGTVAVRRRLTYIVRPDGTVASDRAYSAPAFELGADRYLALNGGVLAGSLSPSCADAPGRPTSGQIERTDGEVGYTLAPVAATETTTPPSASAPPQPPAALALTGVPSASRQPCSVFRLDVAESGS